MKIAFFGLGAMGAPMAEHLIKSSHCVKTAIHHSRAAAEDLHQRCGLIICDSPEEAVKNVEVILTILPSDLEVRSFLLNPTLANVMQPGTVILEMSSCTSEVVCEIADFYARKNVMVVDAPVSGGVIGAQNASLTVFASGDVHAQNMVKPIFDVLAETVYNLGACGMGKTIKNLDNLLSMYNLMGLCEVYHIAKKHHVDPHLFFDVIGNNSGASRALTNRWFKLVNGDFQPGFTLRLARKDIRNALALGEGIPLPMSNLLYELMLAAQRYDDEDVNSLRKLFE